MDKENTKNTQKDKGIRYLQYNAPLMILSDHFETIPSFAGVPAVLYCSMGRSRTRPQPLLMLRKVMMVNTMKMAKMVANKKMIFPAILPAFT